MRVRAHRGQAGGRAGNLIAARSRDSRGITASRVSQVRADFLAWLDARTARWPERAAERAAAAATAVAAAAEEDEGSFPGLGGWSATNLVALAGEELDALTAPAAEESPAEEAGGEEAAQAPPPAALQRLRGWAWLMSEVIEPLELSSM